MSLIHVYSRLENQLFNSPYLCKSAAPGSGISRLHPKKHERRKDTERHRSKVDVSSSHAENRIYLTNKLCRDVDQKIAIGSARKSGGFVTIDTSKANSNADVLRLVIRDLGWKEYPNGRKDKECDIYWHAVNFRENADIVSGRVNKFPGTQEIFCKTNLFRCLDYMKNLFPNEYDFYPRTWLLPHQFHEFSLDVRQQSERKTRVKPMYIVKPGEGSQGDGIYLLRDPSGYLLQNGRTHVVQEYLNQVLLIDRFKFDLRIYVVIMSLEPLQIHICKEGLARFSTIPYEYPTMKNMHETYMHLTNYSLNKKSTTFNKSDKDDEGSKRKLSSILEKLRKMGHDSSVIMEAIERIVCKTIIAVMGELKVEQQAALPPGKPGPTCFQVLGFDIILMKNMKPMLLEVNSNPSLRIDCEQEVAPGIMEYLPSAKDEDVKRPLLRDTLMLVAPEGKYTRRRKKIVRNTEEKDILPRTESDSESAVVPVPKYSETAITIKFDETKLSSPLPEAPQNTLQGAFVSGVDGRKTQTSGTETEEEDNDVGSDKTEDEDVDEVDSCLVQIYPDVYGEEYERLRIIEKLTNLFIISLGCRESQRIGPSGFRLFARRTRLNRRGFTNASVDILYIDMVRKWEHLNPERTSGLCYQGFLDACYEIARGKFYDTDRLVMLASFVNYCQENIRMLSGFQNPEPVRPVLRRSRTVNHPVGHLFPRLTVTSMEEESVQTLTMTRRSTYKKVKAQEISAYISEKKNLTYLPRLLQLNSSDDEE